MPSQKRICCSVAILALFAALAAIIRVAFGIEASDGEDCELPIDLGFILLAPEKNYGRFRWNRDALQECIILQIQLWLNQAISAKRQAMAHRVFFWFYESKRISVPSQPAIGKVEHQEDFAIAFLMQNAPQYFL